MEDRKQEEARFHDMVRDESLEENKGEFDRLTSNRKFYSINRKSEAFRADFVRRNCAGKKVLDFCCGDGYLAISLAEIGAQAYGIDISEVSIKTARKKAREKLLDESKVKFIVGDAENTGFEDNFFDIIFCNGVLHHLNLKNAYPELKRILKPEGKVFCDEPLIHNPVFQIYRRITPQLRTKWETEHILSKSDIKVAREYFEKIEIRFFHLFGLLAVPFRDTFIFSPLLSFLEVIDSIILEIPYIKWLAWQIVFVLSEPKRNFEEDRKIKEIEYYDHEAKESEGEEKESGSRGGFSPLILGSYKYLYELVKKEAKDKDILDYGCGTGIHLSYLAGIGKSVIGIDLSKKSLEVAQKKIEMGNLSAKVLLMDCESLDFDDNSFDIIFDGGVFSSLDLDKALPELARVLRPGGALIGIETFGHNPITNLKRKMNKLLGKRTGWAAEHILKTEDFDKFREYFKNVEVHYFHIVSWTAFPFLSVNWGRGLLKLMESLDRFILKVVPFSKKYSFKVVFVLRK